MTSPEFERARSAEAKQTRERAILDAAARLGLERGVRAVTLTDIAAGVGMHKSTMLRYFETREEIFLRLTAEGYREWSPAARDRIGSLDATPGAPATLARALAETLVARPLFCDLLAHAPLNLERGVSFESVRTFKLTAIDAVDAVATDLGGLLGLTPEQAGNVVTTATSLAGAFWQMAAHGTDLSRFYRSDPDLAHAVVDVGPRLTHVLTALVRGYLAGPA
jgi:AcrR family transcriptional regulator